jgi:hypothetical protein
MSWAQNRPPTRGRNNWSGCIVSAAEADVVLFYAEQDATQCGALVEMGRRSPSLGVEVVVILARLARQCNGRERLSAD